MRKGLGVRLVVLVLVLLVASCSEDGRTSADLPEPATSMAVPGPSSSSTSSTEGPPPLNTLEQLVTSALADLGLAATRAELSLRSASMVAGEGGDELLVFAHEAGTESQDFSVLHDRELDGVTVQRVSYGTFEHERFECGGVTFSLGGTLPSPWSDWDDLLRELIAVLDCSP